MTDSEQREAARQFVNRWRGKGKEDEDGRSYWIDLLSNVLGMDNVTERLNFEKKVVIDGHTKRIDVYIPETKVIIEQKSIGKALDQKIRNSGEIDLTPFEQADRYNSKLTFDERARWIVTSNFAEIWIYDMNQKQPEPTKITLDELQNKYPLLDFLIKKEVKNISHEMEVSIKAGDIVGLIYDAFLKQYRIPEISGKDETAEQKEKREHKLKSLNALCVRIVFCLYAEDAGIFGKRNMFHDYLEAYEVKDCRRALIELFKVLDTPVSDRDEYLEEDLAQFPYVNGGLFADETIEIPPFTADLKELLLTKASADFNWRDISPTIFGAVFESTLNPETRRSGGMHYTSIENIHKVIDPLFLDDLKAEFEAAKNKPTAGGSRTKALQAFQNKLASLTFLDPACGSGNFLTETYLSLRMLENKVIQELDRERVDGQLSFSFMKDEDLNIKVSIQQFYGIEINDFAVTVAKTALWIAESQMLEQTKSMIYGFTDDFLPLKTYVNITEANALRIDWNSVIPANKVSYIMGNPPFIGSSIMEQGSDQKQDIQHVFKELKKNEVQDLDYVTGWYKLAAIYMQNTKIECSFVSTNSICQGSQVPILWKTMFKDYGIHINFAYQTFIWNSESNNQAAVHCVIIGFSQINRTRKKLYSNTDEYICAKNISPYLYEGDEILVEARKTPLCNVPTMNFGNQPRDGGFLVLQDEEKDKLLKKDASLSRWIKPYIGATEFINNKTRWCLWLKHATPADIKKNKNILERIESVKKFRLESRAKTTNGYAKVPHLFAQITQPEDVDYLLIPRVSSQRRRYIPIGFMDGNVIASDAVQIIPNAKLYHFGILTSNVHMAWMRTVAGRLKSDYRYSKEVVYNTFPWPNPTEVQLQKIEQTAKAILEARALYSSCSLADLYDPLTMPTELRKAHANNDRAVMSAYGFSTKITESECVANLMKMYQDIAGSN